MKAIVLNAPHDFCLQDIDDPEVSADELEIQVNLVGICGTDLTMVRGTNPAIQYPIVPGHECMGEVMQAPDGSEFQPGDRVTVFPALGCETCEACLSGRIPHCPEAKTIGVQRPGGYFAERISAHTRRVFKLPDSIADPVGSMVEPTAVAVHANHRGMVVKGCKVVVLGGGTIGLLIAQTALAFGAAGVVVSEPIAERREVATALGITWVCNPLKEDLVSVVRNWIGRPDVVFDVVGSARTLYQSTEMLKPDGRLVLVALPHGEVAGIPYQPAFAKELNVIGSRTYFLNDFPEAIELLASGRINAASLIGKILPLAGFAEGLQLLEEQPQKYFKVILSPREKRVGLEE